MNTKVAYLVAVAGLLLATRSAIREFRAGNTGWGVAITVGVLAVLVYAVAGARRRTA